MESFEERVKRHRDDRIRMGHSYPHPGGYHNPDGVSGVDIDQDAAARSGLADYIGSMMYGQKEWEERRKRTQRSQRVKSFMSWFFTAGCLVISALLMVAAVLASILLVNWLVNLL